MNKTQTTMNKTPYFHKPIHTTSTRKREIERVLRLIRVVKSVRELKRETVRELFFFFFLLLGPYEFSTCKHNFFFLFKGGPIAMIKMHYRLSL